jgi:hypothetical protein
MAFLLVRSYIQSGVKQRLKTSTNLCKELQPPTVIDAGFEETNYSAHDLIQPGRLCVPQVNRSIAYHR